MRLERPLLLSLRYRDRRILVSLRSFGQEVLEDDAFLYFVFGPCRESIVGITAPVDFPGADELDLVYCVFDHKWISKQPIIKNESKNSDVQDIYIGDQ